MVPDPLHPALVHLPIALAVLLPLFALACAVAIACDWLPRRAWAAVVLLAVLLAVGAWAASETGEREEERVEPVVGEAAIEAHEEAAEAFVALAFGVLAVTGLGLAAGAPGDWARSVAIVLSVALLVLGARVGHLGGELVYVHGAAAAYANAGAPAPTPPHADVEHEGDD